MTVWVRPLLVLLMIGVAVAALVLGPGLLPARQEAGDGPRGPRAVPVLTEPVSFAPRQVRLEAVGTSRARRSVVLHPAAAGEVTAVNFRAGDHVEDGQLLLELDRRAEALQLELARVRLAEAERELERNQRMGRTGAVSAAALDTARTAARLARLQVEQAEVALADRSVRAPFAGHVGITDVDPGDRVTPDTVIAPLDDRDTLLVGFEVPERYLSRLAVGDPVDVATWSAEPSQAEGAISYIDTRVDPERRTFRAQARVENPEDRLRPGMSFRVRLALEGRRYPAVPEVSLQWGDAGAYVWTVRDGSAVRVPATIVQRRGGRVLVDAALEEGAPIITEGVQSVRPGMAVRPPAEG